MGSSGVEPPTSRLSGARSNLLSYEPVSSQRSCRIGGDDGIRTHDPLLAGQVLSQLSYTPTYLLPLSGAHQKLNNKSSKLHPTVFKSVPLLETILLRKEVIQPHLPIRLPCYDFTLITRPTFDCCLLTVGSQASGVSDSHGVTGGVYKARERIHCSMLTCNY